MRQSIIVWITLPYSVACPMYECRAGAAADHYKERISANRETRRSVKTFSRGITDLHTMSTQWILMKRSYTVGMRGADDISKEGWTFIGGGGDKDEENLNIWLATGASSIWSDWKCVQTPGMIEDRTLQYYSVGMPGRVLQDTSTVAVLRHHN
jgi:hypothetical protein